MAKFIEVTLPYKGKKLINLDRVMDIQATDKGSAEIYFDGSDLLITKESYEEIRKMVAVAQGGIPMAQSDTKEGAPG